MRFSIRPSVERLGLNDAKLQEAIRHASTPAISRQINQGAPWHLTVIPETSKIGYVNAPFAKDAGLGAYISYDHRSIVVKFYPDEDRCLVARVPQGSPYIKKESMNGVEALIDALAHEFYHAFSTRSIERFDSMTMDQHFRNEHAADVYAASRVAAFRGEPFPAISRNV